MLLQDRALSSIKDILTGCFLIQPPRSETARLTVRPKIFLSLDSFYVVLFKVTPDLWWILMYLKKVIKPFYLSAFQANIVSF